MKPSKTLLFIIAVIAALALVCAIFPRNGISIAGIRIKMPTISHILADNTQSDVDIEGMDKNRQTQAEKLLYAQLKDKMSYYADYCSDSSRGFALPGNDAHFFDDFFVRAEQSAQEGKVVRILHYGDSQIEMDRISDVLRAYMQETFGGQGVGLIPFSQTIPCTSVSQNASGDFTRYASYGDSTVARNHGHYGPMAKCCRVNSSASVSINATKSDTRDEHLKSFSKITVLFDNLSGNVAVTLSCKGFTDQQTSTGMGVHSITWQLDSAVTSARVSVSGLCDVYGIMVDGEYGVSVDNISMRGASGHQIQMIDSALLAQSFAEMNVGLILFQYGGNSVPYLHGEAAQEHYAKEMERQLRILHHTCPDAKIVFIGPADMCRGSEEGGFQSCRQLPGVINALRTMALENGVAFWSMYDVMGGSGSMMTWVNNGLGGGDYLHFSEKGARKMGGYLVDAFKTMYDLYNLKKEIDPKTFDKEWKKYSKPRR